MLKIQTPIIELPQFKIAGLSETMAKKLALATANFADKADATEATIEDLLSYFPMRYEDRSNLLQIDQLSNEMEASLDLYVRVAGGIRVGKNRGPKAPPLYIFEINAGDFERKHKPLVIWWFLSGKVAKHAIDYYQKRFSRGTRIVAFGKWEWDSRRNTFSLRLGKPDEIEVLPLEAEIDSNQHGAVDSGEQPVDDLLDDSNRFPLIHVGRRVPIYRKFGQFQTKRLREIIFDIFQHIENKEFVDILPKEVISKNKLISYGQAMREIHFPPDQVDLNSYAIARSPAHFRLIFQEFFWLTFALRYSKGERSKKTKGVLIKIDEKIKGKSQNLIPFELTYAQKRVLKEVFRDLTSDASMNRLIQGDVGSGKTIIAFLAMFAALENGYQAALMVPTEILAAQHFRNAKKFFAETNYNIELLTGSLKASAKRQVQADLETGEIDAVIGTHAVIQDDVKFRKLGLAIIDEQHRFGVIQRAAVRDQGENPNILVMTATPIPRSLAMTVYGDLDISTIDELPPGRTPIKTVVCGEDRRNGIYKGIEREILAGRQVYIVYPLIEESEKLDLKAATAMFDELRENVFPQFCIGLLHGKLKPAEKDAVMDSFVRNDTQILVATTVLEVGVDVPNANLMIIEHAERFGLSQLHQLRGRVGRGSEKSFCVLLTGDKQTSVAKERLGIMEETSDGFRIAEKDLEIRGQGDILGTRQSGVQVFKIANIIRDLQILEIAKKEAETFFAEKRLTKEGETLIRALESNSRVKLGEIG